MKLLTALTFLLLLTAQSVSAKESCLSKAEVDTVIGSLKTTAAITENATLRDELLKMVDERQSLNAKVIADPVKNQALVPKANELASASFFRVCRILRESGWISSAAVGTDGFRAFLFVITNNREINAQVELLPVLIEAAKRGEVEDSLLASLVDSIRTGSRLPQIFGTQAVVRDRVVYIHPLLNAEKVDEWRKSYGLPPLRVQIQGMEREYFLPVVIAPRIMVSPTLRSKRDTKDVTTELPGITGDDESPLKIDTKLVNLNAAVLTPERKSVRDTRFGKDDFVLRENGVEQQISFFSTTDQPFDLVLLLDFSASTTEKRGLMKKAAKRFIDVARSIDRIAVVAFASSPRIVSPLSMDKSALKTSIDKLDITGGSAIWDSLKFVYDKILTERETGRRSAVVFMTDGVDGSPLSTFSDAMELVRSNETTVFPIYLGESPGFSAYYDRVIKMSQKSLWLLAEQSGGQYYGAKEVKDLASIYEQIAGELGQIYSIGYEPTNETRDGSWRSVTVKLKNRPELIVRARRGYYAR